MARLFSITRCDVLTLTLGMSLLPPFSLRSNACIDALYSLLASKIVVIIMHPTDHDLGRGKAVGGNVSLDGSRGQFFSFNRPVSSRGRVGYDKRFLRKNQK